MFYRRFPHIGVIGVLCLSLVGATVLPFVTEPYDVGVRVSTGDSQELRYVDVKKAYLTSPASVMGRLLMWGANDQGQLGTGSFAYSNHPIPARGLTSITSIAACQQSSLASDASGAVWDWGVGDAVPQREARLSNVLSVAIGTYYAALSRDGTVWEWRPQMFAEQQGLKVPLHQVALPQALRTIAASCYSNLNGFLGIARDGTVWIWDARKDLYLDTQILPQRVRGLGQVVSVAIGEGQRLAVKSDGTVWVWGFNDGADDLGIEPRVAEGDNVPLQRITGLPPMEAVAVYRDRSAAVSRDGHVWEWGRMAGIQDFIRHPQRVPSLDHVVAVALGGDHTLALRSDGTVWAWGLNAQGQLGVPTSGDRSAVPLQIPHLTHVVAVAAGETHSAALQQMPER